MTADKDALLREALDKGLFDCPHFDYENPSCTCNACVLRPRITAALAEKDDGWIKCSERLPEGNPRYTQYLISNNDFIDIGAFTGRYGGYYWDCDTYGYSERDITHWRPLPPLPKGDE